MKMMETYLYSASGPQSNCPEHFDSVARSVTSKGIVSKSPWCLSSLVVYVGINRALLSIKRSFLPQNNVATERKRSFLPQNNVTAQRSRSFLPQNSVAAQRNRSYLLHSNWCVSCPAGHRPREPDERVC